MNAVSKMAHDHSVLQTQRKTVRLHICKTILEFNLRGSRVSFTYSVGWLHTADTRHSGSTHAFTSRPRKEVVVKRFMVRLEFSLVYYFSICTG